MDGLPRTHWKQECLLLLETPFRALLSVLFPQNSAKFQVLAETKNEQCLQHTESHNITENQMLFQLLLEDLLYHDSIIENYSIYPK